MDKGTLVGQGRDAEVIYWENNQVLKLFWEGIPFFIGNPLEISNNEVSIQTISVPFIKDTILKFNKEFK